MNFTQIIIGPLFAALLVCSVVGQPKQIMKSEEPELQEAESLRAKEKTLKWPDCLSPEESKKACYYGNGAYGCSGTPASGRTDRPYKRSEVSSGRWQWVEDKEAEIAFDAKLKHRNDLLFAIKTRPLNAEEEAEVAGLGEHLIDLPWPWWEGWHWGEYNQSERRKELLDLYFQQYRLKAAKLEMEKSK